MRLAAAVRFPEQHRKTAFAVLLSLTCLWSPPTFARYEFDPADLPKNFRCDSDEPAETCRSKQETEAYWNKYGDQYDQWFFALAHDPDRFFSSFSPAYDDPAKFGLAKPPEPSGLLDIRYDIALRHYSGWTMAIDMDCDKPSGGTCRPLLRMTRQRIFDPANPDDQRRQQHLSVQYDALGLATSPTEVARQLQIGMDWLEADLRHCKGALPHLKRFPGNRQTLWPPAVFEVIDGTKPRVDPEDLIVTADGDGVVIRASSAILTPGNDFRRGTSFSVINEANDGANYDWAKSFAKIVEPCLKPATAPSPWDKYLTWHAAEAKKAAE